MQELCQSFYLRHWQISKTVVCVSAADPWHHQKLFPVHVHNMSCCDACTRRILGIFWGLHFLQSSLLSTCTKLFCCENITYLITYLNFTKVSWRFLINSNSNNSNFKAILGNISVILYRQILHGWQMWDHSCAQIQISAGQKWREIKKCDISYYAQYSFILFSNVKIIYTHSRSLKCC